MIIDPNLPGWTSIVFDLCSALVVLDCKWQESRQASDIIRSFVAAPSRCAFCRASWRTFAEVLGEKWLQQWPRSYAVRFVGGWRCLSSRVLLFWANSFLRYFTLGTEQIHLCGTYSRENPILLKQLPSILLLRAQSSSRQRPCLSHIFCALLLILANSCQSVFFWKVFLGLPPLWLVISLKHFAATQGRKQSVLQARW